MTAHKNTNIVIPGSDNRQTVQSNKRFLLRLRMWKTVPELILFCKSSEVYLKG